MRPAARPPNPADFADDLPTLVICRYCDRSVADCWCEGGPTLHEKKEPPPEPAEASS